VVGVLVVVVGGALLVVVLGVVGVTLVVVGMEVKVGPAEAEKPTVPALLWCCFGAGGAAECRAAGLALGARIAGAAGLETGFARTGAVDNRRCPARWIAFPFARPGRWAAAVPGGAPSCPAPTATAAPPPTMAARRTRAPLRPVRWRLCVGERGGGAVGSLSRIRSESWPALMCPARNSDSAFRCESICVIGGLRFISSPAGLRPTPRCYPAASRYN
jgi:hypothetical protein